MGLLSWAAKKVLRRVSDFLPENRISINGDVYLRRFYLCGQMNSMLSTLFKFGPNARERLGFLPTIYLHQFYRPDADRDLHNHPWAATALVLVGGYVEERWMGHPSKHGSFKRLRCVGPLEINRLEEETYHRVDTLMGKEVWTLIVLGPKTQSWGFWSEALGKHVNHRDYNRGL